VKALREVCVLAAVAALPAALALALHPELTDRARTGLAPDAVRPAEVAAWTAPVLWVDARDAAAFARGHVPGAVRLDEDNFSASLGGVLAAWSPDMRVVVYCDTAACSRSRELAQRLREAGLSEVHHLHGGWEAWSRAHATP